MSEQTQTPAEKKEQDETKKPQTQTPAEKKEQAYWVDGYGVITAKSQKVAEKKAKNILKKRAEA